MELVLGIAVVVCLVVISGLVAFVIRTRGSDDAGDGGFIARFDEFAGSFEQERGAVAERFEQLDRKLAMVQSTFDQRDGAIDEKMGRIGSEVSNIVALFNNDRTRGSWGELSLERIFEVAGLVEGRDYVNQFDGGEGRPDVVVFLPGDQKIVIDSKFPTARYLDAMAETDETRRQELLVAHGKELEKVGKSLAKKHYVDDSTCGYVIVFVPSQAVFEAAAEASGDVIERLMELNVIVAGPVNVFALIKTAGTLMAQHRAVSDARQIVDRVRELRSRLGVFAGHLEKVGRGLKTASSAYNSAIGSWNSRLSPSVNRIADMAGTEELDDFEQLTESVDSVSPEALLEAV